MGACGSFRQNTQHSYESRRFNAMGLYLCVFDDGEELEGVEVGSYADFAHFRSNVIERLENGVAGSRFPTLILHSDSDGEWSPTDCEQLRQELRTIASSFQRLPAVPFHVEWQQLVGKSLGLKPTSLYESFIDVDGEPLLERLLHLCEMAIERDQPILFQ
jgi:hypothetical protein